MVTIKALLTTTALLLSASAAQASLVTLQASWEYGGTNFLTFTFDDTSPDTNPDPSRGVYIGSVKALDFTSKGIHYGLAGSTGSMISTYSSPSPPSFGPANWIVADVIGSDGTAGQFEMRIESYAYPWTDAIRGLIHVTRDDDSFAYVTALDGTWLSRSWISNRGELFTEVVPVPGAVWLFGSGLLGLTGLARKRKAA